MTSQIEYFTDLEGTEITLDAVIEEPLHIPAQTWVIVEKLREDPWRLTRKDVSDGMGVSYTSAKFLCHPAGPGNETKLAFMRIRQQVPIAGTEFKPTLRASQAVEEPENKELNALKFFLIHGCEVVPRLLGYQQASKRKTTWFLGALSPILSGKKSLAIPLILLNSGFGPSTRERSSVTSFVRYSRMFAKPYHGDC